MFVTEGTQIYVQLVQHSATGGLPYCKLALFIQIFLFFNRSRVPKSPSFLFFLMHRYIFPPCFPTSDRYIDPSIDKLRKSFPF